MLTEKCIDLNVYIRKEKKHKVIDLDIYIHNLGNEK